MRLRYFPRAQRVGAAVAPFALAALALVVYMLSNPLRTNLYNHFVWQAEAFIEGRFAIQWPVSVGPFVNDYFQDVMPLADMPGYGLIPYPPLPALVVLPLVALFGLAADAALVAPVIGALNVALAWSLCRRLTRTAAQALLATVFYAFGTVAWYAAMLGSTWFLAHTIASTFLLLSIGIAVRTEIDPAQPDRALHPALLTLRQFVAGIFFGLAALARLTTILGAPFYAFVGGRGALRRTVAAGSGAAISVLLLVAYNVVSSGSAFHPAYDYAYRTEYTPRPELRHVEWGAEDLRYIPQNLAIVLGSLPILRPGCAPSLLDSSCAMLQPDPLGMSLLLTSPGYLLAGGLLLRRRTRPLDVPESITGLISPPVGPSLERRLIAGAALAILAIALADLAHFSQGWVQFGYRFSNDFAPFALMLVALGISRVGVGWLSIALVALSVLVNAWGVYWGVVLGW